MLGNALNSDTNNYPYHHGNTLKSKMAAPTLDTKAHCEMSFLI